MLRHSYFVVLFLFNFSIIFIDSASTSILKGWEAHLSPDMRVYYYNEELQISQWEKPKIPQTSLISVSLNTKDKSLALSHSYEQIKIQKFFLRPTELADPSHITLSLQMDLNRISRIEKHAKRWNGPISVAILVHSSRLVDLKAYTDSLSPKIKEKLALHACISNLPWKHYPINFMRNIAMSDISTAWTFVLDSDEDTVYPMSAYMDEVKKATDPNKNINLEKTVFAVTSWQWASERRSDIPMSRGSLKNMFVSHLVETKAPHFRQAYVPPSIPLRKWLIQEKPTFTKFSDHYEPYYIIKTGVAPKFDTRFRGWGGNKAIQVLAMAVDKFRFLVLPRVYTFVDDTPKQSSTHAAPADPHVFDEAWKEMGAKHGCSSCSVMGCVEFCPWMVIQSDDPKIATISEPIQAVSASASTQSISPAPEKATATEIKIIPTKQEKESSSI